MGTAVAQQRLWGQIGPIGSAAPLPCSVAADIGSPFIWTESNRDSL
ncbi:hypothetical protein D8I24_4090 (plasmid) [Cupriavidus necator H850]|nr:hypothetical protein D8I24_4090 [Cupriavidus necator H850]